MGFSDRYVQSKSEAQRAVQTVKSILTLFDMGFFEPSVIGGGGGGGKHKGPHHNFVVTAPMIINPITL